MKYCQTTSSIRDPKPGKYDYFVNPTKCSKSPVHQIKLSNEAELNEAELKNTIQ